MIGKRLWTTSILMMLGLYSIAQTSPANKETIRTAANLETGNSQDVLTSFYQLALSDLTGSNKSFEFKSSLFAIKAKTDPSLWNALSYTKNTFASNFVVSLNVSLDSSYKFSGNTIGFSYAILNKRDKTVFQFSLAREKEWNAVMNTALSAYLKSLNNNVKDSDFVRASNFFNDSAYEIQTSEVSLPPAFRDTLLAVMNRSRFFSNLSLTQYQNHLQNSYDSLAKIVENQPLWVVNADFSTGADGKFFTGMEFNTEYLQGLIPGNAKSNLELNLKATTSFDDNLESAERDLNRGVFSAFAGFNWIMLKNALHKSILELEGGMSEHYIISGLYNNEERIGFAGEGTLRVRLSDNLWIPFDIKYDPQHGNVFGFISVKSNFDWLNGG